MKIVHTIPYFLPSRAFGGPIYSTYYLCRELVKRGHEIVLLTTGISASRDGQKDFLKEESIDGIKVKRLNIFSSFMSYYITPGIFKYLLSENPDIIHAHGYRNFQVDASAVCSLLKRTPLVIHPRGMAIPTAAAERESKIGNFIYRAYDLATMRFSLRQANKIIATTRYEKTLLRQLNFVKEKIVVVPHGVDVDKFKRNGEMGRKFRERYGIKGRILLYVGRIDKGKNIKTLLEAASSLEKCPTIIIAGEELPSTQIAYSSFKNDLIAYSKKLGLKNVIFTGGLYEGDLLAAYSAADVFVNPSISKAENFGLVNLEAAACSLPVVAAPVGVAPDLLEEHKQLLFNDVEELANTLIRLFGDENLRRSIGRGLRRKVEKEYSWDKAAEMVEKVYFELI